MKQNAYTLDTSDIVIPLTELLGDCYIDTDPHPLSQYEKVANMALNAALGQVKTVPIVDVLNEITIYQGREGFNNIADYMVKLWARFFYFIDPIQDDLYGTHVTIISISAGDVRLVFDELHEDSPNARYSV